MIRRTKYDAIVVGAGPNGLAAAITLARANYSVFLIEARETVGGGTRSAELTLPGFLHDICSAVHPLGLASPFFDSISLNEFGLEWIQPPSPMAHPFDNGSAALLERDITSTSETLGEDARAYRSLMAPLSNNWKELLTDILGPFPFPPKHPYLLTKFGLNAIHSASGLALSKFQGSQARSFFAGLSAHSKLPLGRPLSAAFGLVLGTLGHSVGWPIPRNGSQAIANALASYLISLGGEIQTGWKVDSIEELPSAKMVFCDVTPRQLIAMTGNRLPGSYRRQLERYRYGPGVFKIDWALNHPIPWKSTGCTCAGTVHLGGKIEDIIAAESAVWAGIHPQRPFVLLSQPSFFDPSRAPKGMHTAWAYCHVPNGSTIDMTERIESQVERFAPGFRDCILSKSVLTSVEMEAYNPNYVGGDINGGVQDLGQLFTRPTARWVPYSTPVKGLFLCSSATPPGGGVHGMCGYHAVRAALNSKLT